MAQDSIHPDNWDEEKKLFMTIIEVNHPGFSLKGWAEVAAKRGLSEATVKQRFGESKKRWIDATKDVIMPAAVIKPRKRCNKGSVANDEDQVEEDGDDVPSAAPNRPAQATSSVVPASSRARRARRTAPTVGNDEIEDASQFQSEAQSETQPNLEDKEEEVEVEIKENDQDQSKVLPEPESQPQTEEDEVENNGDDVPSEGPGRATQATSSVLSVNNRVRRTRSTATKAENENIKETGQPQLQLPVTATSAGDKRKRASYDAAAQGRSRSKGNVAKKNNQPNPTFEKYTRERRAEIRQEREERKAAEERARQAEEDQDDE